MEHIALLYKPKDIAVSYQEFQRPSGYAARIIHMHDVHEICLIASRSQCELFSGGNRWQIQGPAVILHRAGSYHELLSIGENGEPYDGRVIYFRHEGLPDAYLPGSLFDHDCLTLPLSDAADLLPYFDLVKNEPGQRRQLALLMLLSRMAQLEAEGDNAIWGDAVDSYIFDVIKDISEHLDEALTVRQLAGRFHVSESKLKKDFSATTGTTVKQFTTRLRLRLACRLLQNTSLPISDVAYQCSFSGESHFIEVFRTHLGTTPGKFRKRGNEYV